MTAADALQGRRPEWGAGRRWQGNYLASVQENANTAGYVQSLSHLRAKDRFQKVSSLTHSSTFIGSITHSLSLIHSLQGLSI